MAMFHDMIHLAIAKVELQARMFSKLAFSPVGTFEFEFQNKGVGTLGQNSDLYASCQAEFQDLRADI